MTDYSTYDMITFKSTESNMAIRKQGVRVGKYFAITREESGKRKIYLIKQGMPFLDVSFADLDDAVQVAEWLDETFRDYFPILEIYPDADLISLVRWTIPQGLQIHEAFASLLQKEKIINKEDVMEAMREAQIDVPEW